MAASSRGQPLVFVGALALARREVRMDLHQAVALTLLPGISRQKAALAYRQLTELAGEPPGLHDVIATCNPALDPAAVAGLGLSEASVLLKAAAEAGIAAVPIWADAYPPLLRTIVDPPVVIWVRGRIEVLTRPAVAVVGSRAATPYALEVAARLGSELAGRGVMVVSGLARGVDGAAHRGCLDCGGPTLAVLGSGPDVIYPSEHAALADRVRRNGALLSELGPGGPPLPEHFPQRNRLISGISIGVVVVEASDKSGSLITARCALDQGRDVMAVPGSVLGGRNRGSHALLKDGAKIVETADDILDGLGWPAGVAAADVVDIPLPDNDLLATVSPGEAYGLDELGALLRLSGPPLLARITDWEMQGRVVRLAGGRFMIAPFRDRRTDGKSR